ncbi:MAG: efflux RND transporter periplasmic adaptor subunit [Sutterellaceae bacterium]|nr:efflux RND transporter periplasmic adaptor subunit [Sutterellaceae bacterium]MDD7442529.1 efflux RND transporter periplasmic adaptor subunit [Sutterellaceae bacterium]MDY2867665.1 efflux RND transporter periplasmic adaptor subunit [Mesosutterella sp.]
MKRRTIFVAVAAAAAAVALGRVGYTFWMKQKAQSAASGGGRRRRMPTSVLVSEAKKMDVSTQIPALGTVTANRTVNVTSQVQGRITAVYFTEGQYVKRGALLAKIDTRTYEANRTQYEGSLTQAEAQLANARSVLERYQKLYAQHSISKQDLDAQAALVRQYEGAVRSAKGQVSGADVSIGYGRITAPISGYIGIRQIDIGNLVSPGDSSIIATITETEPIAVEFSIPQVNLDSVAAPIRAGRRLKTLVYDQSGEKLLAEGEVSTISNAIDAATGTLRLKAVIPNAEGKLFPNQFVNVKLVTGVIRDATVVPNAAIQTGTSGDFVFTVDEKSVAHKVPVKRGPDAGNGFTAVLAGVYPGDRLITTGVDSASDGGSVTIVTPTSAGGEPAKKPDASVPASSPRA